MIELLNNLQGPFRYLAEAWAWLWAIITSIFILGLLILLFLYIRNCVINIMIIYNQAYENFEKVETLKSRKTKWEEF